eukprot:scaffold6730_cov198-Amphora_coffeaeformis.AAC.3
MKKLSIPNLFGIVICTFLCLQTRLVWRISTSSSSSSSDNNSSSSSTTGNILSLFFTATTNRRRNANHHIHAMTKEQRLQSLPQDDDDDDDDETPPRAEFYGDNLPVASDPDVVEAALRGLPPWIVEYVTWHRQQRAAFPGAALWTHPDAPPLLVRTCFGICGGLNDRVGQIPWDLYLANQTGRVLLWHWHRPAPLESWFTPFILDWRVPLLDLPAQHQQQHQHQSAALLWFPIQRNQKSVNQANMLRARQRIPNLFDTKNTTPPDKPNDAFFGNPLDQALERARSRAPKILRHRLLGHLHEHLLEARLRDVGETDMIHSTPTFGRLFRLLLQPSVRLRDVLDSRGVPYYSNDVYNPNNSNNDNDNNNNNNNDNNNNNNNVPKGQHPQKYYTAVHCRVRHPKVGQAGSNAHADKQGLPWQQDGPDRLQAIATANHALHCAQRISSSSSSSPTVVALLADSADLVHYYVQELSHNETFRTQQARSSQTAQVTAAKLSRTIQFLSHTTTTTTTINNNTHDNHPKDEMLLSRPETILHLDLQKGHPVEAYDGTFVDFYTLVAAECIVLGVGNFAWLAAKVSQPPDMPCVYLHQPEAWGSVTRKLERVRACPQEEEEEGANREYDETEDTQEEKEEEVADDDDNVDDDSQEYANGNDDNEQYDTDGSDGNDAGDDDDGDTEENDV